VKKTYLTLKHNPFLFH